MGIPSNLLGGSAPQSTMPAQQSYTPELEHRAKANGFHSAEEMMLWAKQRSQQSGGTVSGQAQPSLDAAMSWHPAVMFHKILGTWQDAVKDNQ